ncbi:tyrosine-type recombinase/integrase [Actinomadura rupiterrae]|uniref:tyrosine-type recombinase/integrase n=1 Tax=Actinomadura rupiterrae TaxID=559627 RepID=UPI0020A3D59E|nr:tyrosine-type recombinase/integrase [Actinomadura rupiterrae]MCP2335244.1 integrase [Actinomadura rupiterrae]
MASIERRTNLSGRVTWRVRWRVGGHRTGRTDGETCDSLTTARDFAARVQLAGERRPEGYPKGCRGLRLLTAEPEPEPEPEPLGFGEVVAEYLATLVDADRRTVADYRRLYAAHVEPATVLLPGGQAVGPLGALPIGQAAALDIWQGWVGYMRTKVYGRTPPKHYSAKTIRNIHGTVLAPVLDYAVMRGYCEVNPCRWVRLPTRKGRPVKAHHVLDVEEFAAWIDCAYAVDDDTGDITALILGTGIRWGELTALRPCDVRLTRAEDGEIIGGLLTIAQVAKEDENRQPYIDTAEGKSENAFRTIAIGTDVAQIIIARQADRRPTDLLFSSPGGGIWRNTNFHNHRWVKVKALALQRGLTKDPSPHRLRHAHATALIPLHGIESVSKRLGHANAAITSAIYSHLTPATDLGMATSLDGRLRRPEHPHAVGDNPGGQATPAADHKIRSVS